MRTSMKLGLITGSFTVLFACGSGESQPVREPSVKAEDMKSGDPALSNRPPQTASNPLGDPKPQEAFSDPSVQKPTIAGGAPGSSLQAKEEKVLSDAEVVTVALTVNEGEIQLAELAKKNATSQDVKQFAAMMITHHSAAAQKEKTLMTKATLTRAETDTSRTLKSDGESALSRLKNEKGKDFDKSYIDQQVKAHQDVLAVVDNQLLPSAKNADVKAHVTEIRRTVSDHVQKAEAIQKKLGGTASLDATRGGKATTQEPARATEKADAAFEKAKTGSTPAATDRTPAEKPPTDRTEKR